METAKNLIPQYMTELPTEFVSADTLQSLTLILEGIRRYIFEHPNMLASLSTYALGLYKLDPTVTVNYQTFQDLLRKFDTQATQEEARSVFSYLDFEGSQNISVLDLHESLLAYISNYDLLHESVKDSFRLLYNHVDKYSDSQESWFEILSQNAHNFHIEDLVLEENLRIHLKVDIELVINQIIEFGDFLYKEGSYIYNIVNFLKFLNGYKNRFHKIQSWQGLYGLHHYEKFVKTIGGRVCNHIIEKNEVSSYED